MIKEFLLGCLATYSCLSITNTHAQTRQYRQAARQLYEQVQSDFYQSDNHYYAEMSVKESDKPNIAYLWSLASLWQADNELERSGFAAGSFKKDLSVIKEYYDTLPPASGYDSHPARFGRGQRYYDDNEWLGLAAVDAYFRTKDISLLHFAENIYTFMLSGFDTASGGGIYWRERDNQTKNTCSNGPGIVLALKLYKATHHPQYLDTAITLYNWTNRWLRDSDGLYFDNIRMATKKIGRHKYSYNTGTMLQANVLLFECTGDRRYLEEAIRIAQASKKYFYASGHFRDGYWFNAVMLRAYQYLFHFYDDDEYIRAFKKCVDNALGNDRNKDDGLMGKIKIGNLVEQGGMIEILARLGRGSGMTEL